MSERMVNVNIRMPVHLRDRVAEFATEANKVKDPSRGEVTATSMHRGFIDEGVRNHEKGTPRATVTASARGFDVWITHEHGWTSSAGLGILELQELLLRHLR